jgi:2-dehydropantoate 2-reductase
MPLDRTAFNRPPRITVAGAGSIGCFIGGSLALAGQKVTLLLRPELAQEIEREGLRISDIDGNDRTLPARALRLTGEPAAALADADVVLVTVKSGATAEIAALLARHARADAVVVSLQNGVGNVAALRACLGPRAVIAGMIPYNVVTWRGKGAAPRFHRATSGTALIADMVRGLDALLNTPGAPFRTHRDMPGILWGKLIINLNNALNALSGLPLATQLADRRWRVLLAAQMREALAVLAAASIRARAITRVPLRAVPSSLCLPDALFNRLARRLLAIDPEARSSMADDLARGRRTEIDHLQGAIVALGRQMQRPTPISSHIVALLQEAEAAGVGSPKLAPEPCWPRADNANSRAVAGLRRLEDGR